LSGAKKRVIDTRKVPVALKARNKWVLWREGNIAGRQTKVPYFSLNGALRHASSTDPKTWTGFFSAKRQVEEHHMNGPGTCFDGDGIAGADFDGCRNPKTGEIEPWALDWLKRLDSYSEVSPSGCGVKTFVRGRLPEARSEIEYFR
jgi:primase-polymerase (primpol)-like protein